MTLLAIKDLIVRYGEIEAVHGVTLDVEEGQVVTLLGSNGAGKPQPPSDPPVAEPAPISEEKPPSDPPPAPRASSKKKKKN